MTLPRRHLLRLLSGPALAPVALKLPAAEPEFVIGIDPAFWPRS
jgi:hypothetical protein